ncbi:6,7-dimethyl-8-ribityllumazine synthase [Limosilactobacillus reuteri]|uniref:6,7-dimethyl-8-ribityllumazine synthase n=1 Tax=Limosilactobacillus reuteri TaxID=1598 RepID=A0A317GHT2_LIMRT|nr:6,7-dimethyl-8-ribityllumazine synthase [Limosilactobacillus reuteri]MCH5386065.1 6,7-dimethyl-8-ribityllumazine synthase [Limosilactobacillus reuteri]PWT46207.1 6,7-dimethyl-8-ribityllumazine synthase [Limosilactobacillus reuteri]PWT50734.1 6,7-dimethyl-8-ribityllumazine synthase [Limosilactobacillus reuteri]PWT61922.1 6,7-dimethyl-8-ribityllumazine synthase [Limosilactobacillus reuteri]
MKEFTGKFNVQSAEIGIVVADFNETVTKQLVQGATEMLAKFDLENVDVYHVPGAFEILFMTKQLLAKKEYDGILTLGAVIKGETDHYDLICQNVASGVMNLNLTSNIPITFGILTTDNIEQAMQRAGLKAGNEGAITAQSLLEMISLNRQIN